MQNLQGQARLIYNLGTASPADRSCVTLTLSPPAAEEASIELLARLAALVDIVMRNGTVQRCNCSVQQFFGATLLPQSAPTGPRPSPSGCA
jgi:hypothetical protein